MALASRQAKLELGLTDAERDELDGVADTPLGVQCEDPLTPACSWEDGGANA